MYQKIKYLIIGTIIVIIFFAIIAMDAGTRYKQIDKQKTNTNDFYKNAQTYNTDQNLILQQQNLNQITNNYNEEEIDRQNFEKQKEAIKQKYAKNNTYTDEIILDLNYKPTTIDVPPNGHFEDLNNNPLKNYTLQKTFKLGENEYAILTLDKKDSSTDYTLRKFYIYQKSNETYRRCAYLFDHSEMIKSNDKSKNLKFEATKNNITITYAPNITRTFDEYQLKTGVKTYINQEPIKFILNEENTENNLKDTNEI